jgi:MYXO-CTERM domain-containing protein
LGGKIWDESGVLRATERSGLARRLRAEAAKTGADVSIVLVQRLPKHEAIGELARRTFLERHLDASGPPQVLLVVAKHERRAALETGLGPAGIVPEIDARQITRHLAAALESGPVRQALEEAVVAIANSVQATQDRRRPAPADPLDAPPAEPAPTRPRQTAGDVMLPQPSDEASAEDKPAPPPPHGRSLLPTAAMLSALVVLGLALRRRRRATLEHQAAKPGRPGR